MGGEQMPPMDYDNNMNNEVPADNEDENDQNFSMNNDSDYDTNFDAGVEADEDTDPKKFIQQLTGKLSQSLNTYNNENGEPDVELGKYVLGMLIKQGTKGMDETDKKELIKKMKSNNESESDNDSEIPEDDTEMEEEPMDNNMKMESKTIKITKKQIFENFGIAINNDEIEDTKNDTNIQKDVVKNKRTRPFEAPTFKE